MKPPHAIGSVPSLSGHAIAYRWRSLPRVRRHRASKPQGSSERVLPWQITMDQLIFASLSHTHYWYEVGMLKVQACNSMEQPGKVTNPARGQLNRKMFFSLSPFAPENLVSRDAGSAVPSRVSLFISILRRNPVLFRGGIHLSNLNLHMPLGQFRVHRVTRLCTDGVHCRESAGTGPVNHKVVPNGCCLGRSPWTNYYGPLFPTPTIGMKWAC